MNARIATERATSERTQGSSRPPLFSVSDVRDRARRSVNEGAVTTSYGADREAVIAMLNGALATELVCVMRYRAHYFLATGLNSESVKDEFLQHANEELAHADRIAERIIQLGGEPDFSPKGLDGRAHAEYVVGRNLEDMIKEDLVAERIAVETYTEMIRYLGDKDPTTRRMLEDVLAQEEEHADELSDLIG
ncbi:MAG: bacterioferritin [Betaproteobacteria bacterium]|nr:bacterioferritin [Betaproteobacteria bacterium]